MGALAHMKVFTDFKAVLGGWHPATAPSMCAEVNGIHPNRLRLGACEQYKVMTLAITGPNTASSRLEDFRVRG